MSDTNHNTEGTPNTAAGPLPRHHVTSSFTVRFWDYSQMPSNRTAPKPLKTLDRKISNRKKFRFSGFGFLSLFLRDVTLLQADSPVLAVADTLSESITLTTLGDGHTVPSKNVATLSASTKVEKLMDTLSSGLERRFS